MRIALPKLFGKKRNWEFQKADLTESTEELKNPARGWYQIFTFYAEEKPDFKSIYWCLQDGDVIALVIINISAFREKRISNAAIMNMRAILNYFREQHYDVILRVTYDHEGYALEKEPFFFAQVKEHMKQVAQVVKEFQNTIFVYQGLLVGSWGEMHTSKFVTHPKLKDLWSILKEECSEEVFFAVRKPSFWRALHPESCGKEEIVYDKMGLFDDAIFGSATHLGTFGEQPKEMVSWESVWNKENELDFEDKLCTKVPNGGEALCGEQFMQEGTAKESVETLKKMHITYLNKIYDKLILKLWKEWKWEEPGVWQNVSVHEYIGKHLGYRFWIKDVQVLPVEGKANRVTINIKIENVGFANIYQDTALYLEWIDHNGNSQIKTIDSDMKEWNSGSTITVSEEIGCEIGTFYLSAKRIYDGRAIYLANRSNQNGRVFLGEMTRIESR